MSESTLISIQICQNCGATCPADAKVCWLCKQVQNLDAKLPILMPAKICRQCRVVQPSSAEKCSTCQQANPFGTPPAVADNVTPPPILPSEAETRTETIYLAVLILCVVLSVLIGIGIGVQDTSALMVYLLFVTPVFLATGVRALKGLRTQGRIDSSSVLSTFLWSSLFSAIALFAIGLLFVLLAIASLIALIVTCLSPNGVH